MESKGWAPQQSSWISLVLADEKERGRWAENPAGHHRPKKGRSYRRKRTKGPHGRAIDYLVVSVVSDPNAIDDSAGLQSDAMEEILC